MRPFLIALTCLLPAFPTAETLSILHTNDIHSRIEPVNRFNSTCSAEALAENLCFGGSARLLEAVRAARAAVPAAILVDGGDQFQGSLMYTHYKGKAAAEMMNALSYDAMTIGNHEFDDGPEVLRAFVEAVGFPVLMSNADIAREPELVGKILPSTVITRGGQRYGLVGLTPEDTPEIAKTGPNITFHDPIEAVRREIARLEAEGISRIIVLSHSGYETDKRIAAAVDGIDVIVGGHSHTLLANEIDGAAGPYPTWVETPSGGRTAIVQAYAYGRYLGRLDVAFDEDGTVTAATGGPLALTPALPEDPALKARVAVLAKRLEALRAKVVAQAATVIGLDHGACRKQECTLGNLVADALLHRMRAQGAEVAIVNGGGLRAPIDAGPVTHGEVLEVLPFQNTLAFFSLTGADLRASLEHGVSAVEDGHGRFPQVAGLRFAYDPSIAPGAGRVRDVEVFRYGAWEALSNTAVYDVVTNDFLRRGGDGYAVFAEKAIRAYDFGPDLADVVIHYLSHHEPYTAYTDGRIRVE